MSATDDLNNTITSAINARVETAVLEALSGDEFFGKLVSSALHRPVEIRDSWSSRSTKVSFLDYTIQQAMKDAVAEAVKRLVEQDRARIEDAVRDELRQRTDTLAKQLVGSVSDAAEKAYGVQVQLRFPGQG